MLNGKAKYDFERWRFEISNLDYNLLPKYLKQALIINWFDSIGLNILLTCEYDFGYQILEDRYGIEEEVKKWYETRELANESAIKKANEIYNNKNR